MKTFIQPFHSLSRIFHDSYDIALSNPYFDIQDLLSARWHAEGNRVIVKVPVPGMSKEDLVVHLEGRVLVISTKERIRSNENIKGLRRSAFKHFITVPKGVDTDSIRAKCRNGLLTITIDKKSTGKKHTVIKVHGAEDSERKTSRLELLWNKIKEKIDVRKMVRDFAHA